MDNIEHNFCIMNQSLSHIFRELGFLYVSLCRSSFQVQFDGCPRHVSHLIFLYVIANVKILQVSQTGLCLSLIANFSTTIIGPLKWCS